MLDLPMEVNLLIKIQALFPPRFLNSHKRADYDPARRRRWLQPLFWTFLTKGKPIFYFLHQLWTYLRIQDFWLKMVNIIQR